MLTMMVISTACAPLESRTTRHLLVANDQPFKCACCVVACSQFNTVMLGTLSSIDGLPAKRKTELAVSKHIECFFLMQIRRHIENVPHMPSHLGVIAVFTAVFCIFSFPPFSSLLSPSLLLFWLLWPSQIDPLGPCLVRLVSISVALDPVMLKLLVRFGACMRIVVIVRLRTHYTCRLFIKSHGLSS